MYRILFTLVEQTLIDLHIASIAPSPPWPSARQMSRAQSVVEYAAMRATCLTCVIWRRTPQSRTGSYRPTRTRAQRCSGMVVRMYAWLHRRFAPCYWVYVALEYMLGSVAGHIGVGNRHVHEAPSLTPKSESTTSSSNTRSLAHTR